MAISHTDGPITAGTIQAGRSAQANVGYAVLEQSVILNQNSTNAVSATVAVPAGAQLVDIIVDVLTPFNSATSAGVTVGNVAAGTQYSSNIDVKTAGGRFRPTFTAAQLLAMSNVPAANTNVVATVTPVGATSAGQVLVIFIYVQY